MKNIAKDNYSLQRMSPSQWREYKSIRLEALKTNPDLFGSNYDKEVLYNEIDWTSLLENDSRAMFALYHAKLLVGLTGITLKKDDATTAIMFASFIKLPHRGRGLSKLFYQARIDWARQKRCKSIIVSHRVGNASSKAAIQQFGFKYSHAEQVKWPDGVWAEELIYLLELNPEDHS